MNIFQKVGSFFQTTEADVVKILIDIKTDAAVAIKDIDAALSWLAGNAPAIATQIQGVVSIVTELGVTTNPEVAAAVVSANVAVQALNAFAASYTAGKGDAQSVIQGYIAVKQAQAAASSAAAAAAAAAAAPTPPKV